RTQTHAPDALDNEPQDDRAPADEHRRRVEVRHRWTAADVHAGQERPGMQDQGQPTQPEGGAVERLEPSQPGAACQQEHEYIENRALVERLEVVEKRLEARLAHVLRPLLAEIFL